MVRDEIYMLWLSSCYTLGSRKQNELLARFGTAREIFNAPVALLRMVNGINDNNINAITENRSLEYIENLLKKMEAGQMSYVSRSNDSFPYLLREIPDAPVGLFCVGTLPQDGAPSAAIIGSRRCSEYGLTAARMLSKPLSRRGIVIVSGMARGADSMAHHGAIEGGGKTIAVMGCGADVCYPPENKSLRNKIIEQGCVISEYPPGTQPFPAHFPARNRIISGLSSVVVVVEAEKKSGTLITASQAADQGREVMAVPGNIISKLSEGTNILIRDGASLAADYRDVLFVLGLSLGDEDGKTQEKARQTAVNALARDEKIVYDSLTFEPLTFDRLAERTGSAAGNLHHVCTMLELKGFIKKLPGLRYIRNI